MRLLPLLPHLLAHLGVAWPLPVLPFTLALPAMLALTPGPLHSLGLLPRVLLPASGSPPGPPAPPTPAPFPACFPQGTSHSEVLSLRPAQGLGCPGALYVDESAQELQRSSQACWLRCRPPFQHPCSTGSPYSQLPAWASCFAGPGRCLADPPSGLSPGNPPPQAWLLASCLCHCPLPGASQTSRCPLWLEPLVVKCWAGSSGFLEVWLRLRPAFRASLGPPAASCCCTFLPRLAWFWGWAGVLLPSGLGSVLAAAELEGRTGTSWTWQPWVCSQLGDLRLADPSEPGLRCGAHGHPCCPHFLVWGMWPCTGPKLLALFSVSGGASKF